MTRCAMSARTLREGGIVASVRSRATPKGPSNRTATDEDDAPRTSIESTARSTPERHRFGLGNGGSEAARSVVAATSSVFDVVIAGAAGSALTLAGAVKRRWKRRFDSGRRSAAPRDASATPLCTLAIGERLENDAAND